MESNFNVKTKTSMFYDYGAAIAISVFAIFLWEFLVRQLNVPRYILPPPSEIFMGLLNVFPIVIPHTLVTLFEATTGLLIAASISIVLAAGIVHFKILERTIYPYAVAAKLVPIIALAPLLTVWFGFGLTPKVITAILVSYFPIFVTTVKGFQSADRQMIKLMNSLSASRWQIFTKVTFPYALPYFFSGLRVGATLSVVGALVGEFVGADRGLGFYLIVAQSQLNIVNLFAGVLMCASLGLILFMTVVIIERRAISWHESIS